MLLWFKRKFVGFVVWYKAYTSPLKQRSMTTNASGVDELMKTQSVSLVSLGVEKFEQLGLILILACARWRRSVFSTAIPLC